MNGWIAFSLFPLRDHNQAAIRRQGFLDRLELGLSECLAHLFSMLGGLLAIFQAPLIDSVLLDPFALLQDLVTAPEVDVSRCQVLQTLVVSVMVVVTDEPADLSFQIAGK